MTKYNQHFPTPDQRRMVEAMSAYGIPEYDIARVVGISPHTLRKHYRDELDLGHIKAIAQVAGFLFNSAKNGNVSAQIFFLKCRGGWSEYAPAPMQQPQLGKKEQAQIDAVESAKGTEWGNLVH